MLPTDLAGTAAENLGVIFHLLTIILLGTGPYLWLTRRRPVESEIAEAAETAAAMAPAP